MFIFAWEQSMYKNINHMTDSLKPMRIFIIFSFVSFLVAAVGMIIRESRNGGYRLRYYDCRMRFSSAAVPVVLALMDVLAGKGMQCAAMVVADLALGPLILLLCPARHEKAAMSYRYARLLFWIQMSLSVAGIFVNDGLADTKMMVSVLSGQGLLLWYLVRRTYMRYGNVRKLFSNLAVWHGACDMSRFVYAMGLFLALSLVIHGGVFCAAVADAILCALYVACYIRVTDDTGLLAGKDVEICIKDAIQGRLYERAGAAPDDDRRMMRLFERAKAIMDKDKPYRDELFSLPDFASMLLTNKVYLSRTINMMAGCNFRNFLNWYRIEDAKALIKEHPEMKLADVMIECGFRTHQTFEAAFLRQCGENPREYQERVKVENLRPRKD